MQVQDTLLNLVSGLGTTKDKSTGGRFASTFMDKAELDALYTGDWLARTIVDAPAEDMTRQWRSWNGGPRQIRALAEIERHHRVRQKATQAMKQARLYGGSVLLLGDGAQDASKPLRITRRSSLLYVHVLSRYEINPSDMNRDPLSEWFGEPEFYTLGVGTDAATMVHPSRVIRFLGHPPLETGSSYDGWGISVLQPAYEAVRNAAATAQGLASLVQEAKVDVIKIPNLTNNVMDEGYRAQLLTRFGLANTAKSINSALLLDAAEEWDQKQVNLASMPDVLRSFLEMVSGAANIPATRLLGTSPKGMNATGQSDTRNYYDHLSSRQRTDLQPTLERLDEALIRSALGARPSELHFQWNALWQMTEAEQSAIAVQKAQAAEIYATLGVMAPSALRAGITAMLLQDGLFPGLQAALDVAGSETPAPLVEPKQKVEKPSATARAVKAE